MKKLLCVAQVFRKDHYGRDVFLIPYYMGQQTGAEVTLAFPSANSTDIQAFAGIRRGG